MLKIQEDELKKTTEKLNLQKDTENVLKQEIETSHKTIFNLQEKEKANDLLLPTLENTIDVNRKVILIIIYFKLYNMNYFFRY